MFVKAKREYLWEVLTLVSAVLIALVLAFGTQHQKAYGVDTTIVASKDTKLQENNATTNYASDTTIAVDGDQPDGTGKDKRAVMEFDVSGIPSDATVAHAILTLDTSASANIVDIHEVLREWNETEATWNKATSSVNWATAGAKGASDIAAKSASVGPVDDETVDVPVELDPALVQKWVDNSADNHGILLEMDSGTSDEMAVHTREATSGEPELTVYYDAAPAQPSDTTIPTESITGGPSGTTTDDSPSFTFSANDTATLYCSIQPTGGEAADGEECTSGKTYSNLPDGEYTFAVVAQDDGGNLGDGATRTFTIDVNDANAPSTTLDYSPASVVNDNLLSENQTSVETDLTGISPYVDTTVTRDTTVAINGGASAKADISSGNVTDGHLVHGLYTLPPNTETISANTNVIGSVWVKAPSGKVLTVALRGETPGGSLISESGGSAFTANGNWQRVSTSATTWNQDFKAGIEVIAGTSQGAFAFNADSFKLETGSSVTNWSHQTLPAEFGFSGGNGASTYECRFFNDANTDVDTANQGVLTPWTSCSSPQGYYGGGVGPELYPGKYKFEVRAINGSGVQDPTPASASFTFKGEVADDLEGEALSKPAEGSDLAVVSDSSYSGGQAMQFTGTADRGGQSVTLNQTGTLKIRAKGVSSGGSYPSVNVYVDGEPLNATPILINSSSLSTFTVAETLPLGTYEVAIGSTDANNTGRTLTVDKIEFQGQE